jgi:HPt (histidine-containing phosphotransfer) domain-containing protein
MEEQSLADAEEPANDASALDRLKRFGGGKLLTEMIALFLTVAPERVAAARQAHQAGDLPTLERALHSLKGSAAQLGARRLQRLSERGERLAGLGTVAGVPILVQELDEELARVCEWLIKAREEGTG